jgi:hypothetical protein
MLTVILVQLYIDGRRCANNLIMTLYAHIAYGSEGLAQSCFVRLPIYVPTTCRLMITRDGINLNTFHRDVASAVSCAFKDND